MSDLFDYFEDHPGQVEALKWHASLVGIRQRRELLEALSDQRTDTSRVLDQIAEQNRRSEDKGQRARELAIHEQQTKAIEAQTIIERERAAVENERLKIERARFEAEKAEREFQRERLEQIRELRALMADTAASLNQLRKRFP